MRKVGVVRQRKGLYNTNNMIDTDNAIDPVKETFLQKTWHLFLEIIQDLTLLLSGFVLIYLFLFRPHQVNGMSMYPNFHDKEFVLSEQFCYHFRDPRRGEVVIFKAPPTEPCAAIECEYIKRIVALPGEMVIVKDNAVYINDRLLEEEYLPSQTITRPGEFLTSDREIMVPKDSYLLLGDNRGGSRDGRDFGFIKKDDLVGRALLCYWPIDRFGIIQESF